ncbi:TraG family conjugative transposon ATPase [Chitinophaga varians]|uniref:TraG family conjugative transposon ATPase n=1 Tax=Chitinophaga varians TaxID=2202339 RepID=A0A847S480_9BACT|nr:TraG family conjugative transposon ATPase [Chitinophaga varians]NLR67908.1 TraG family conjugative transposon ATPase [Chitinophaga varians]
MFVLLIIILIVLSAVVLQIAPPRDKRVSLEKCFPIYKVKDGNILSRDGDITIGLKVFLPEIFTLNTADYENIHATWIKAMKVLPSGTIVHKQDWFVESSYKADFEGGDQSFLGRSSERFYNERPYLNHYCYLFITRRCPGRRPSTSVVSNLLRRTAIAPEIVDERSLSDFSDRVSQFQRLISDGGFIRSELLTDEEITGNAEKRGLLEQCLFLQSESNQNELTDISFKPEWRIGEKFCQMFSIAGVDDLPSLCGPRITYDRYSTDHTKYSVGFSSPANLLLSCNHIYNQFIVIQDTVTTLKNLEAKRRRLQSLANYSRENMISRDATNDYLNESLSQQRQPVSAHFNIIAWTADWNDTKEVRNKCSAAFSQMDAVPRQEVVGAPQLYWASLPGNAGAIPGNELFSTFLEQACCFLNFETNYQSSVSPFGLRLGDRVSGRPLHVDISDEFMKKGVITNRNKIVIGGSGSGKSMFMNSLIRSYQVHGAHSVILDVGGSYVGLCNLLGGYYFSYTEDNPIQFNPFYIGSDDTLDIEKRESLKTLLIGLWKRETETFNRSEYVAISNALQLYYSKLSDNPSIFPCFDTFYEFLQVDYMEVLENERVQGKDFDITNMLYVLKPYYKGGEFSFLLNARGNLDLLNQRLVVVELDNIKDHPILFPVVTLLVMEMFISKMRKVKGVRKVIVIEEAWKAIMRSGMAEFMKYLYKTVRKHFGEAITVTQELSDLISSPIVKDAIISNADCKILLDLRKFTNKFSDIQNLLGLSDKGKELVLSVNRSNDPARRYRELFIDLGGQVMKVYRYEPSPEEYWAFTTEESEKVKVLSYASKFGGDIERGIKALLRDL